VRTAAALMTIAMLLGVVHARPAINIKWRIVSPP
jgi:hypothetical protein